VQLFHQLLTQLEAVDNGEKKVLNWCSEAETLMASVSYTGEFKPEHCIRDSTQAVNTAVYLTGVIIYDR
jgi:hypothetical protein